MEQTVIVRGVGNRLVPTSEFRIVKLHAPGRRNFRSKRQNRALDCSIEWNSLHGERKNIA